MVFRMNATAATGIAATSEGETLTALLDAGRRRLGGSINAAA